MFLDVLLFIKKFLYINKTICRIQFFVIYLGKMVPILNKFRCSFILITNCKG